MEAYSSNRFHQKCVSKQLAISESDHGSVVFHAVCWCVRQQLATVLCCKYSIFFFQQGTVTKCVLPEAGVYELDGRVHLTHSECLSIYVQGNEMWTCGGATQRACDEAFRNTMEGSKALT